MTAICAKIVIETIDSSLANFVRTIAITPVRAAILAASGGLRRDRRNTPALS